MDQDQPEHTSNRFPWLETILTAVLAIIVISSINVLFGDNIREGVDNFCTQNNLWCAPPTPTPTATPTPTPTPTETPIVTPTFTPTTTPTLEPTLTPTPEPVITLTGTISPEILTPETLTATVAP